MPSYKQILTYSKRKYLFQLFERFYSKSVSSHKHVDIIRNLTGKINILCLLFLLVF